MYAKSKLAAVLNGFTGRLVDDLEYMTRYPVMTH